MCYIHVHLTLAMNVYNKSYRFSYFCADISVGVREKVPGGDRQTVCCRGQEADAGERCKDFTNKT